MSERWEFRAHPGGRLERFLAEGEPAALQPGQVRLRLLAGGICGSDLGVLEGISGGAHRPAPLHEVVGEVTESRDDRLPEGQVVVGTGLTGLAAELVEDADRLIAAPEELPVEDAVAIQSLSTVLRAVGTLPPVGGGRVVVFGTGPIGLSFIHMLAGLGASRIVAVDPVAGREGLALRFGAHEFVAATGQRWAEEHAEGPERPSIVIDAVGRQPQLIADALRVVADGGYVLGFGSPSEGAYAIPFDEMYHRRLTLASGRTREDWVTVLERGTRYLLENRDDFAGFVTDRFAVDDAQRAYDLCARPDDARVKVALVAGAVSRRRKPAAKSPAAAQS
ncbi:MAG: zinc-binding dehydrogenase [Microbacteriaceae bacterium]|nr:zinc-binding dehydrogenase [Microbacteriaceae bacterium]